MSVRNERREKSLESCSAYSRCGRNGGRGSSDLKKNGQVEAKAAAGKKRAIYGVTNHGPLIWHLESPQISA